MEGSGISAATLGRHWQCEGIVMPTIRSKTYEGVMDEIADYIDALRNNKFLQKEFISILKMSGRNLLKLTRELRAVQEALGTSFEPVELKSFPGINSKLSAAPPLRLEEVKALTLATEAFRGLPAVALNLILSLTSDEKTNLFRLFKEIPLSSSVHSFIRPPFPESDSLYSQLLRKIGFGQFRGHLIYETDGFSVDKITLMIVAIHAVTGLQ